MGDRKLSLVRCWLECDRMMGASAANALHNGFKETFSGCLIMSPGQCLQATARLSELVDIKLSNSILGAEPAKVLEVSFDCDTHSASAPNKIGQPDRGPLVG